MATHDEQLTAVFSALADPTRRAILSRLAEGDASVAELARPFSMSQPASCEGSITSPTASLRPRFAISSRAGTG